MLSYWAGIYYGIAQIKWNGGEGGPGGSSKQGVCVDVAFDPPSNTLQPPLGTQTTVKAMVKTKAGESVKAEFHDAHAYSNAGGNSNLGSVSPEGGPSDGGSPMKFVYIAPNRKIKDPGFQVAATSRAGAAVGEWHAGLGTGWSGQITYLSQNTGDNGHSDLQSWSGYGVERITINVKDGVGTLDGYVERKYEDETRQPFAIGGGKVELRKVSSTTAEASASGTAQVTVEVNIDQTRGSYQVLLGAPTGPDGRPPSAPHPIGKSHLTQCDRSGCNTSEQDIWMPSLPPLEPLAGKLQDPNHVEASYTDRKEHVGRSRNGVAIQTMSVVLARSGSK
jgi:hypothetical protein